MYGFNAVYFLFIACVAIFVWSGIEVGTEEKEFTVQGDCVMVEENGATEVISIRADNAIAYTYECPISAFVLSDRVELKVLHRKYMWLPFKYVLSCAHI